MEPSCSICTENFTTTLRRPVTCPGCSESACTTCYKQYFLSSPKDPNCMHCARAFDIPFMMAMFPKSFVGGELRKHRETTLVDLQRALLPQTQDAVVGFKEYRKLEADVKNSEQRLAEAKALVNKCETVIHGGKRRMDILKASRYLPQDDAEAGPSEPKKQRVCTMPCPLGDCKGFLNGAYVCGICESHVCSTCHEKREKDHVCDPAAVQTIKAIKMDSKACPGCSTFIYKISGCPQMFCTNCHVFFDWNTLKIQEGGVRHNPHFFDWLRENGKLQPDRNDCFGRIPTVTEIQVAMRNHYLYFYGPSFMFTRVQNTAKELITTIPPEEKERLVHAQNAAFKHLRVSRHGLYTDVPELNAICAANDPIWESRLRFLAGELTEAEFKAKLSLNEQKIQRAHELRQVIEGYCMIVGALFDQFIQEGLAKRTLSAHEDACVTLKDISDSIDLLQRLNQDLQQAYEYTHRHLNDICSFFKIKNKYIA